jgi:Icc-related predicted phosphoesterase
LIPEIPIHLLVIADIEDLRWKHSTGKADILLSCGDVSDHVILEAADAFKCRAIFAVKGNHDSSHPFPDPIVDLHRISDKCSGVTFGGFNGAWKYKPRGWYLYDQSEVEEYLAIFPGTDIFISHNSPRGIHDRNDGIHTGFDGLTSYIARAKPKILVHGHHHVNKETTCGETQVIGVHGWRKIQYSNPIDVWGSK